MTRTISTSVPLRTMSNTPVFGRDAKAFLVNLGIKEEKPTAKEYGINITAIVPLGNEKKTVRVLVANPAGREEFEFSVLNIHAEELLLSIGEIEDEILHELEYYAEVAKAYSSACASFAFTPSSYSALFKKLLTKGFPKDVCEDTMACIKATGFVKEDEIALRRAQIFVGKRWGRMRILMKLREEGFADEALILATEYLDGTDFPTICAEQIRKKYGRIPEDDHGRKLMYASLSRMGFSASDIKSALKLL